MSDIEIAPLPAAQIALFGDLQKNWGWLLALGVLSIVLGTIGLGASFSLTLVTVLFFGWLLLVGGGFQLVGAFSCRGWRCVLEHMLAATLVHPGGVFDHPGPTAGLGHLYPDHRGRPGRRRGAAHRDGHPTPGLTRMGLGSVGRDHLDPARWRHLCPVAGVGDLGHRVVRGRRATAQWLGVHLRRAGRASREQGAGTSRRQCSRGDLSH